MSFKCAGQTKIIDSLRQQLKNATGIERFNILYDLTFEYYAVSDFENALDLVEKSNRVARALGDSLNIVKSGRVKGQILQKVHKDNEAMQEFEKVLPISRRNKFDSQTKHILNSLAIANTFGANYDSALKYHFESLQIREKEGNQSEISTTLNNIGLVYFKLKNYEKALEFYFKSLAVKENAGDTKFKDDLLINIGLCYNQLKRFEQAHSYLTRGLALCKPNCSDDTLIDGEFGLGVSLFGRGQFEEAKTHLSISLQKSYEANNLRFQAENLIYLGKISVKANQFSESIQYLTEAEKLATQLSYDEMLMDIYKTLTQLYLQKEDYKNISFYQARYITLKDSVYSAKMIDNLTKIQADYEERENIKTIREQDELLRLKDELIKKQRSQYFFILTITILSITIAFVFIRFNRAQHQTNVELAAAKKEIEDKNRALENSNAILDARVKDRTIELEESNRSIQRANDELDNFIYKTSHDIRGPLASLKGMTNVAMMDVTDPVALEYFQKLDTSAEKLNIILTRLVIVNHINHTKLMPELVDLQGMIDDIILLERKKGVPQRMKISYEVQPGLTLTSDRGILRIAMENLIGNAIKFYSASERIEPFVAIRVRQGLPEKVEIIVQDNGIGIHEGDQKKLFHMFARASEKSDTGGIGLYLAKLSTEKLKGNILYRPTAEKYTQFIIELPADLAKSLNRRKMTGEEETT